MFAGEEKLAQEGQGAEAVIQVVTTDAIDDEEFFPDGGLRAWLVVIGCFSVNSVIVGFW
jgi:hypothetical protein